MPTLALSDSESNSLPKNGQVQIRAHARAAFASETIGSINYPCAMQFHRSSFAKAIKSSYHIDNSDVSGYPGN
jgi:hypothetical protein